MEQVFQVTGLCVVGALLALVLKKGSPELALLLALAAVAAGADGLIIEVHNDPQNAKCDGQQSLTPEKFDALMGKIQALTDLVGKTLIK